VAVSATLEDIGSQSYRMCDAKGCHVLWSCFGSGSIAPDAALPGGRSAFEAIVARDDGGPVPPN
ncbi:MAG: hypothetical protein KDJ29_19945, partial [Hyphomicrobiales bacterium]|nr:hypothetical protein [Hyphomicrobiales bacterium]